MYYEGEIIGGHNKVLSVKHGGMGIVYLCIDERSLDLVALKTIPHQSLVEVFGAERFINEARIWIGLGQHTNIVEAYKVEILDGFPFIFMEQVVNESKVDSSLRTLLTSGSFSISSVINIAIDICSAFSHAHKISPTLVHRDLKPENILINVHGVAKVTDFGLSHDEYYDVDLPTGSGAYLDYLRVRKTKSKGVVGTPMYMAPELWTGNKPDIKSDIYSFGCILYEMLANRPVFVSETIEELKKSHIKGNYVSVLSLNKKIPNNIASLIHSCLEGRKENRPESFEEILPRLLMGSSNRRNTTQNSSKISTKVESVVQSYINMGMYESAKEYLSNRCESIKDTINRNRLYFYIHFGLGEYDEAKYFNELILSNNKFDIKALQNKAALLACIGRQEEAVSVLNECLRLDNDLAPSYINLGHIYREKKEYSKALNFYKKAARINPYNSSLWHGMACAYDSLGENDKWIYSLKNAVTYTLDYSDKILFFMGIINTHEAMYFDEYIYDQLLMSAEHLPSYRLEKILNSTGYYKRAVEKLSNPNLDQDFTTFYVKIYVYVNIISCCLTNGDMRKVLTTSELIVSLLNEWVCLKEKKDVSVYEYGLATLMLLYTDVLFVPNKNDECVDLIAKYSNEIKDESLLGRLDIGLGNYYLSSNSICQALKHYTCGIKKIDDEYLYDVFGFERGQINEFISGLSKGIFPEVSGELHL